MYNSALSLVVQNITKGAVAACVRAGADSIAIIKAKTKAGTGCGGCELIFQRSMKINVIDFQI